MRCERRRLAMPFFYNWMWTRLPPGLIELDISLFCNRKFIYLQNGRSNKTVAVWEDMHVYLRSRAVENSPKGHSDLSIVEFWNCHINFKNFKILMLYMLDFENMKYINFQFNVFIIFGDIHFLINLNMGISKCSMRIRFLGKNSTFFCRSFRICIIIFRTLTDFTVNELFWPD